MYKIYNPLVSVIMPAYNAGRFIEESIVSVVNQIYTNWELIIVDDGSTDDTKLVVTKYVNKHTNIYYHYQNNGKQGKARNLAIKHAKGNYIAFIDADDIWMPEKLELQLEELSEHNVTLIFSDAWMFEGSPDNTTKLMQSGKGLFIDEEGLCAFLEMNKIPVLTVLVNANALMSVKCFSENPAIQNAEDYHLWLKLLMNGCSAFGSDKALAKYRLHATSSSSSDKLAVPAVIEAFEDLKKEYKLYRRLISRFQKKWFNRYHYSTNHWRKKEYKQLINKNCRYLNKAYLILLFEILYFFAGLNITRKIITKTLNT